MYRKRRMTYIIVFIFIPCIIVPLIYLSVFFYEFKSRVFNEISFTAETEDGESYNLRARYDKDELLYSVNVPEGISLSDILITTAERGVFEIDDVIYENGDTIKNIEYDTEYDIKMYTEDGKLLNEAALVFSLDTGRTGIPIRSQEGESSDTFQADREGRLPNPNSENPEIAPKTDEGRLTSPEGINRQPQSIGERGREGFRAFEQRHPLPVYEIGLGLVFGVCCLYLLYRQLIVNGILKKGGGRK